MKSAKDIACVRWELANTTAIDIGVRRIIGDLCVYGRGDVRDLNRMLSGSSKTNEY